MALNKADIRQQLQKEIFSLQGFKSTNANTNADNVELGPINEVFPDCSFPLGAVHEFFCARPETTACTSGFIAGILSSIMKGGGVTIWICKEPAIFPPALMSFGIDPEKVIFFYLRKQQEILWCVEEALKCKGIAAVVAELRDLDFISSRRLQLATSKNKVTCFVLHQPSTATTASVARWKVLPLPSIANDDLPGVGFPQWRVELLKVRNGKTGTWQVQWAEGSFHFSATRTTVILEQRKKAG
jgi:protein ImuA